MKSNVVRILHGKPFDLSARQWEANIGRARAALDAGNRKRALEYAAEIARQANYLGCHNVPDTEEIVMMVSLL
jgi:hypothetical protein